LIRTINTNTLPTQTVLSRKDVLSTLVKGSFWSNIYQKSVSFGLHPIFDRVYVVLELYERMSAILISHWRQQASYIRVLRWQYTNARATTWRTLQRVI